MKYSKFIVASPLCRIPKQDYDQIRRVADEYQCTFALAYKIWHKLKFPKI